MLQQTFDRGSTRTARRTCNVRASIIREIAYLSHSLPDTIYRYEKQMKKISRNAAGISTTAPDKDQNKLETELFLMEVAYVAAGRDLTKLNEHICTSFLSSNQQIQNSSLGVVSVQRSIHGRDGENF